MTRFQNKMCFLQVSIVSLSFICLVCLCLLIGELWQLMFKVVGMPVLVVIIMLVFGATMCSLSNIVCFNGYRFIFFLQFLCYDNFFLKPEIMLPVLFVGYNFWGCLISEKIIPL